MPVPVVILTFYHQCEWP